MSKSTPIQNVINTSSADSIPNSVENDETIQEVLQSLGAQPYNPSQQLMPNQSIGAIPQPLTSQSINQNPYMHYNAQHAPNVQIYDKFSLNLLWDRDARASFFVAVIFASVFMLPVETFVFKYLNIEHIPHSSVIIKAAFAAILFYITSKLWL